ncbi:MAG: methylated-DNA--[protein]-cysteine S-methyltransferase [Helicobacteraceae bacterium]
MGEVGRLKAACYQRRGAKLYALARGAELLWLGFSREKMDAFIKDLWRLDLASADLSAGADPSAGSGKQGAKILVRAAAAQDLTQTSGLDLKQSKQTLVGASTAAAQDLAQDLAQGKQTLAGAIAGQDLKQGALDLTQDGQILAGTAAAQDLAQDPKQGALDLMWGEQDLAQDASQSQQGAVQEGVVQKNTLQEATPQEDAAHFAVLFDLLDEYFDGKNPNFLARLDLTPRAFGRAFSQSVWAQIAKIPYGKKLSYADLARRLGSKAHRAVGTACGKNPLAIIIPCHRVIRSSGLCGAYAGGAPLKKRLLELERD